MQRQVPQEDAVGPASDRGRRRGARAPVDRRVVAAEHDDDQQGRARPRRRRPADLLLAEVLGRSRRGRRAPTCRAARPRRRRAGGPAVGREPTQARERDDAGRLPSASWATRAPAGEAHQEARQPYEVRHRAGGAAGRVDLDGPTPRRQAIGDRHRQADQTGCDPEAGPLCVSPCAIQAGQSGHHGERDVPRELGREAPRLREPAGALAGLVDPGQRDHLQPDPPMLADGTVGRPSDDDEDDAGTPGRCAPPVARRTSS